MNISVCLATSCKLPKNSGTAAVINVGFPMSRVIAQVAVNNRTSPVFQNPFSCAFIVSFTYHLMTEFDWSIIR